MKKQMIVYKTWKVVLEIYENSDLLITCFGREFKVCLLFFL